MLEDIIEHTILTTKRVQNGRIQSDLIDLIDHLHRLGLILGLTLGPIPVLAPTVPIALGDLIDLEDPTDLEDQVSQHGQDLVLHQGQWMAEDSCDRDALMSLLLDKILTKALNMRNPMAIIGFTMSFTAENALNGGEMTTENITMSNGTIKADFVIHGVHHSITEQKHIVRK